LNVPSQLQVRDLVVSGTMTLSNALTLQNMIINTGTILDTLNVSGVANINSNLNVTRNLVISGVATMNSTLFAHTIVPSSLIVSGTSTFNGGINIVNATSELLTINGAVGTNVFNEASMNATMLIDKYLLVKLSGDTTQYYLPLFKTL
jgi:hypothetical protein